MRRTHKAIIGQIALAAAACALTARYLPFANRVVLAAAVLFPYLAPAGPIAVVSFVIARRWMLASAAATVTAIAVATQAPLYRADNPPTGGINVRAMTANLMLGRTPADTIVDPHGRGPMSWPSKNSLRKNSTAYRPPV